MTNNFSCLAMSSRFTRRIYPLLIIPVLILIVIIIYVQRSPNSFYNSLFAFNTNNGRYQVTISPALIKKHKKPIADPKSALIHQPSSNMSILRGLLLFYPNDQESDFSPEFRWFYRSWTDMMLNESTSWRTDLIVYASEYASIFKTLACTYDQIRLDAKEKPTCRVFPYVRIKDRRSRNNLSNKYQSIDNQRSQATQQYLKSYGYIDSINTVLEYNASYFMYDFILRTDMDCFLTHNFARYVPQYDTVLVGHGGYSTEFNNKRLKRIARDMNWKYADQHSLGSTWYGSPSLIHHMADYTIQAMTHLVTNEFTTPEREQKLGVMLWPEWHFGVLLLYGGHLAINHLVASVNASIRLANQLLDQGVTSKDQTDISKNLRLHLHCWHGSNPFSKFEFKAGKYNQIDSSTLVSDTSASGYAMRMALESKTMTLEQLKQKLLDIQK